MNNTSQNKLVPVIPSADIDTSQNKLVPVIPSADIEKHLGEYSKEYPYSCFNPDNVEPENTKEYLERMVKGKKDIEDSLQAAIIFRPERVLFHEVAAALTSSYSMDLDEGKFQEGIKKCYQKMLELFKNDSDIQAKIIELKKELLHTDELRYNKELRNIINHFVEENLSDIAKSQGKIPLSLHEAPQIHMLAGGIASGKSTTLGMITRRNKDKAVNESDVFFANPDSFRKLVMEGSPKPGDMSKEEFDERFTDLSQIEARLITKITYSRLANTLSEGKGPHHIIDRTTFITEQIDAALKTSAGVFLHYVSTKIGKALLRAFERGKETGRYAPTSHTIESHYKSAIVLLRVLEAFKGKNVTMALFDNNAEKDKEDSAQATTTTTSSSSTTTTTSSSAVLTTVGTFCCSDSTYQIENMKGLRGITNKTMLQPRAYIQCIKDGTPHPQIKNIRYGLGSDTSTSDRHSKKDEKLKEFIDQVQELGYKERILYTHQDNAQTTNSCEEGTEKRRKLTETTERSFLDNIQNCTTLTVNPLALNQNITTQHRTTVAKKQGSANQNCTALEAKQAIVHKKSDEPFLF